MDRFIVELSKYVITFFMALYTIECFATFRHENEDDRNGIYIRQNIFMFAIHFTGFMAICFETGDPSYLIFYGFQQILLFATIALFHVIYPKSNRLIVNNMCMLLSISFIILTRISYEKSIKQFKIILVSLIVGFMVPFLINKFKLLKELKWVYALVGLLALGVVYVLGAVTNGSKISYTLGGYTFQPSEFVKIIFVLFVAGMLVEADKFSHVFLSAFIAALHILILVCSKDLGSALIFFIVYISMLLVATKKWIYLFLGSGTGIAAAIFAYKVFTHVQVRVQAWKDPWSAIDGAGYQITQSLFAIGTGGWFGMGIFQGSPMSIPYVEADFVFSAVAEEFGVIFALCMILVCLSCFLMFMRIARSITERFYMLTTVGIAVMYAFQVFLTIGGGTKFIPLTGVTLPLVSYGGSSVLTTIIMFSIIQGLNIIKQDEGEKLKRKKEKRKKSKRRIRDEYEGEYDKQDEYEEDSQKEFNDYEE